MIRPGVRIIDRCDSKEFGWLLHRMRADDGQMVKSSVPGSRGAGVDNIHPWRRISTPGGAGRGRTVSRGRALQLELPEPFKLQLLLLVEN